MLTAIVGQFKVEVGHDVYKPLEGMLFATTQRIIRETDGIFGAEMRVSRILAGSGME
jgi:hypothetical protein